MSKEKIEAYCQQRITDYFLEDLALLCERYQAEFEYTKDDDGIHISLDGKEVFHGFLTQGDAASELRRFKEETK